MLTVFAFLIYFGINFCAFLTQFALLLELSKEKDFGGDPIVTAFICTIISVLVIVAYFRFYRKSTFNYDRVSKNVYNVTFESSANTYKFTYIIKRNRSAFGFDVEMTVDSSSYIKYSHMANNSMVNILLNLITTSDDYVIHRAISYIYVLYSKSKLIDPVELNELIDIFIRTDDHCKSKLDEFIYRIKNEPTGIYNAYNSIKHYSVTMDEFYPIFETIKDIICKCI